MMERIKSAAFLLRPVSLVLVAVYLLGLWPSLSLGQDAPAESQAAAHLKKAAEAGERQAWLEAAQEYKEVLSLDPANAEVHARLGVAYQNAGMVPEAIKALEEAFRLNPSLPEVPALLGLDYARVDRYTAAIPYLEKAFAQEDQPLVQALVGRNLAQAYFVLGKQEEGLKVIQKLRDLYPDDPDILYTASKIYANLWNAAIQRLIAKSPGSYQVHQVLAEVLEAQGKYAQAAAEYRRIIQMEPSLPGAHYRLGRMVLQVDPSNKGNQEALLQFQKELEIEPTDVPTHVEIGELELQFLRPEEASKYFTRALELDPSYTAARVGLAKVSIAQKNYQRAVGQLEEAVKDAPEDEEIYYNLMIAYRSLGKIQEAKTALDKFQSLKKAKEQSLTSILGQFKGTPVGGTSPNP
jgi:tetratricopeptide (TPR) repeat protein